MKNSFLATLLWSSTDDACDPLDLNYAISDVDNTEVVDRVICQFISLVEADPILISIENITELTGNNSDTIAHDLCLTINRYGAGFWDGEYSSDGIVSGTIGDRLTAISHTFTEIYIFENDNDNRLTIEQC